jgi:hypothetical protein
MADLGKWKQRFKEHREIIAGSLSTDGKYRIWLVMLDSVSDYMRDGLEKDAAMQEVFDIARFYKITDEDQMMTDWVEVCGTKTAKNYFSELIADEYLPEPKPVESPEQRPEPPAEVYEHQARERTPQSNGQQVGDLGEWDAGDDPGPIPPRQ